ncbi:phosphotransferase family protein [Thauera linaloolentis]|uniref:Putative aminoglycoside phosphotransferase n=1 Tax=Thauera linaloolentis (strain DSM 12138 / JCM 21573 / CCUG 41526 / CIP 105981 / IAM 15112 / NBRC 102519 / 47Lol) TaxID=1123367 RepID=N6YYT4_THAL4|nr:phosphotransferase family protein [Thauera linaloolentis]ENO85104.1 putative aminoglycoside phosphotransferase [Thauera linaloolentis 47Lol = DSM 12138]MCM8566710.1 phosphotransferase family protein [Thauera linaloolentis]
MNDIMKQALAAFIARAAGADGCEIGDARLLSGGAIQENWLVAATIAGGAHAGTHELVVRTDSPSGVAISHNRAQEFALLKAAHAAGVTVPEPLWLCEDREPIGRQFFVMRRVGGTAAGHRLVKDAALGGDRVHLAERLGEELARIHSIRPPRADLAFLPTHGEAPALHSVKRFRAYLDGHHTPHPALEWGLRWLERHAPPRGDYVLCHRDFRTGNYMVDEHGLTGVLDWEFAGWSDPLEDIGWFCARCWRFGANEREAGGVGAREDFYRGYERVSGKPLKRAEVFYWEVMAHMHWAIIAIQQAERHVSGEERSLLLALTGHIVPELEYEILSMTGGL